MSTVNYVAKEINCKVVYYGPGLGGKTTNLQYIYENTQPGQKGELVALSSENQRTLFFDFLPLSVGNLRGYQTRFHLYTVPGQTFYDISRQFILKGVDGLVFVADSQRERMEENMKSMESLEENLDAQGYDLSRIPMVLQYNKRDLPTAATLEELESALNPTRKPYFEATANNGKGVMETLNAISQLIIQELKSGVKN